VEASETGLVLADDVIGAVAICSASPTSLAWCATCKSFRQAQPPLRGLSIASYRAISTPGQLSILLKVDWHAHRTVDSIHPRYAADITHLELSTSRQEEPDLPLARLETHGAHLTSLRVLDIHQGGSGIHADECMAPRPADCVNSLIKNAKELRSLMLNLKINYEPVKLLEVLITTGPRLHYLHAELIPWSSFKHEAVGSPAETTVLQSCATKYCSALKQPAYVQAHKPENRPLYSSMNFSNDTPQQAAWRKSLPSLMEWYAQVRPKWRREALGLPPSTRSEFVSIEIQQHDTKKAFRPGTCYRHSRTRPLRPLLDAHVRRAKAGELSFGGCGRAGRRPSKSVVAGELSFYFSAFPSTAQQEIDPSKTPDELGMLEGGNHILIGNLVINWLD